MPGTSSDPGFVPTLLNVSFIVFALFLAPYFDPPVLALAWAVAAGGIAQLVFSCAHEADRHARTAATEPEDAGVWRVMKQITFAADPRRLGRPDLADHQHDLRLVPGFRQRFVDVLRRPADGIPDRGTRRRTRPDPASFAVAQPLERQCRRILAPARLGTTPVPAARTAFCRRARGDFRTLDRRVVPVWQVRRARRTDDAASAGRLFGRTNRT